jgi:hypothetical protein
MPDGSRSPHEVEINHRDPDELMQEYLELPTNWKSPICVNEKQALTVGIVSACLN